MVRRVCFTFLLALFPLSAHAQGGLPAVIQELQALEATTQSELAALSNEIQALHDEALAHEAEITALQQQVAAQAAQITDLETSVIEDAGDIAALQVQVTQLILGSSEFLSASLAVNNTPAPAQDQAVKLDRIDRQAGSTISYDTTTGQLTLQPGTYLVAYSLQVNNVTNDDTLEWRLFDVTSNQNVPGGFFYTGEMRPSDHSPEGTLVRILSVTAATVLELRRTGTNFTGLLNADQCRLDVAKLN